MNNSFKKDSLHTVVGVLGESSVWKDIKIYIGRSCFPDRAVPDVVLIQGWHIKKNGNSILRIIYGSLWSSFSRRRIDRIPLMATFVTSIVEYVKN